jgi:4-alpha-glucanotransferase
MTHPEEQEQSETKTPSRLRKILNWFKTQTKAMKDYKVFCETDTQTLEMYTAYRLPTPPKDKPFTDEYPDPATNPLLMEMRDSAEAARTGRIIEYVWYPSLALLVSFFHVLA